MDGEGKMIDIIVEAFVNLFQSCMFIGFLFFFFDKPKNKIFNAMGLFGTILVFFVLLNIFTFYTGYVQFLDILVYVFIMEIYTLFFLKGNVLVKVIMPIINILVNAIISFLFGYIVSIATEKSFELLIFQSSVYRYFCIAIVNITNVLILFILLKLGRKKIKITNWTDTTAFIIIPFISMFIIHCTFFVLTKTKFQSDIVIFLLLICLSIIVISIIMWVLIKRISKDNEVKTKLLLSEQREQLYEENVLQTNNQIEKIAKIKHDMKNNLMCIEKLISDEKIKEAQSLCSDLLGSLSSVYTPLNTENPLLNAIVNVELEKAVSNGIAFAIRINDDLKELRNTSDIVSIIGNLCDNAIEYLINIPVNDRKMYLEISLRNRYYIITCKNRILNSVLGENPLLQSKKDDLDFHGKGTEIIRNISKKYDGDVRIYEEDNFFCSSVILEMPSLPEKA